MTLQNSYSVTETFGAPQAGPSDVPLMAMPQRRRASRRRRSGATRSSPNSTCCRPAPRSAAGLASTSIDPVTHNRLSAEQKLYGPLHVTTAVTDVGQPTVNKSITAGFKLNW